MTWGAYVVRISLARSAQASKARDSERTSVLSQSKRRVVIYFFRVSCGCGGLKRGEVRRERTCGIVVVVVVGAMGV